ncbi:MAG: hypothetical protein LBI45_07700, partial [Bacteroidales bacterium]|jgi:hypothetical protein|nr:hypothetical protein [Bacteroidales bacterium]
VLKVIGCSFDESEIAILKQRAHYERERMYGATLFDPIEKLELTLFFWFFFVFFIKKNRFSN